MMTILSTENRNQTKKLDSDLSALETQLTSFNTNPFYKEREIKLKGSLACYNKKQIIIIIIKRKDFGEIN